jgi:GWxTD domain-containing protein
MTTMHVRGNSPDSCRLDVYTALSYSWLRFTRGQETYVASYRLQVSILDTLGRLVAERTTERMVEEADRTVALGATDAADITQTTVMLPPGTYRVEVRASDQLSSRQQRALQQVTIPDFRRLRVGLSGILLVQRIEERNRRYVITPIIGSDISSFEGGVFVFFELYAAPQQQLQVRAQLLDSTASVTSTEWQSITTDSTGRAQHFVRLVPPIRRMPQGSYVLRVQAALDTSRVLASSERTVEIRYGASSSVFADISKAIRQLRYIATQAEIDSMLAKPTDAERRATFEQFWQQHDPTPGTLRNEAFEEYFARVEYANRNFRSYTEGWLTDMGMVYIVLGEPSRVERRVNPYDNRSIVIWTYDRLSRRYIFIDNTGFGDYRLSPSTPFFLTEKYRYRGGQQ